VTVGLGYPDLIPLWPRPSKGSRPAWATATCSSASSAAAAGHRLS